MAINTSKSAAKQAPKRPSSKKSSELPKNAILVPVDFFPHSEAAIGCAAQLADFMKAPLVILHVVHDPVDIPGFYTKEKKEKKLRRMEDLGAEMLEEFIQKGTKKFKNRASLKNASSELVVGIPATRILEVVKRIQPKMVVMGSQGRTGLGLAFLGSTAEHVMRQCPVPITIVKVQKQHREEV